MKVPLISLQVLFLVLFNGFDTTRGGILNQGNGAATFPKGYSVRPGDNAAYKFYTDKKSWADARDRCVSDGGHLAILDTPEKVAHVRKIIGKGDNWVFVGLHKPNDTGQWIRVDDDSSVTSIPWEEDVVKKMPYRTFKCSILVPVFTGLLKWNCDWQDKSLCEIPIIANPAGIQTKQPKINASSLKNQILLGITNQTPSPTTLPKGYSIYPGYNAGYKLYTDEKTWKEASDRCISDGGHLAIVDTPDKVAHVQKIIGKTDWVFVGIHRSNDTEQWIRVDSDSLLTSIPWDEASAKTLFRRDFKCAMVVAIFTGLMKWNCDWKDKSLCEIPIIDNQAVTKTKQQTTNAIAPKRKKSPKTTTQAPSSLTLPEGYLIYPGYNAGYKLYTDRKPWDEARDRCISDGGRLAIVDTPDKIKHLQNIIKHLNLHKYYMQSHGANVSPEESIWAFIGLHKLAGSQKWIRVDNGLPVTSVPFFEINPKSLVGDNIKCGLLPPSESMVSAWDCKTSEKSLCEIPLSKKQITNWIKLQKSQASTTKDDGYTIYPTYNAAYKLYTDRKTWDEARERCISDGGHLAIVDTTDKARHIRNIMNYLYLHKAYVQTNEYKKSFKQNVWAFIGIHKRARAKEWTRVDNELLVRFVPWLNTKPTKQSEANNKCGLLRSYEDGLVRWKCAWKENSLCEKPIGEPDTVDEKEFQTTFAPPKKGKVTRAVTILLDADDELPNPPGSHTKDEVEVEYIPNQGSFVNFVNPKKTVNQIGKKSRTTMKTPAINPRFAVQYPEIQHLGITYKIHEQYLTHDESRKKCVALGGRLAVIDSLDKKNVISSVLGVGSVHVEIVPNPSNFNEWGQLYNGVPQSILSLVSNNRRSISCPALKYDRSGLEDTLCSNRLQFVCETPANGG